MQQSFADKSEKITWFEKKLNKWIKNFEDSEHTSAVRHNSMITKINEVDKSMRNETTKVSNLVEQMQN